MFQTGMKIIQWASIPVLLFAAVFSRFAAGYGLLADFAICLGAVVLIERAIRAKDYLRAVGLVGVVIVFSPLLLVIKIFLLMGLACIVSLVSVVTAFRIQPAATKTELV